MQKKIESQRAALKEWEKNSKKVYKEIKHNEIMQEKERYELLLKIKELKTKVLEQRKDIKSYQTQISVLKHKENEAHAKKQLATIHGTASFTSSTNITPDRSASGNAKRESPEVNPVSSIISAGGDAPDPNIGGGLQVVTEEKSDGGEDHGNEGDLGFK